MTGQDSGCALSANQEFSSRLKAIHPPIQNSCWLIRLTTASNPSCHYNPQRKDREMTLFTNKQFDRLMKNGHPTKSGEDHKPVVKLVLPGTGLVFLLTEIDNDQPYIAFGLCDLGLGCVELGYVSLTEIGELITGDSYKVECDPDFEARHSLSVYTKAAQHFNGITTAEEDLQEQICLPF